MADQREKFPTSAVGRLLRLGSLAGRVGASAARESLRRTTGGDLAQGKAPSGEIRRRAEQVAEVLGTLKGVPMKIGQMLSLHEDLLPPEVAEILSSLQQDAPAVPFREIDAAIRAALGPKLSRVAEIEPEAWAAASIGQVHRGRLSDGRRVVFKVQYPGIDKVISADLKNLKGPLGLLFGMFTDADLAPFWSEVGLHLHEELDYDQEARHMDRMTELWRHDPQVRIPRVVHELTTRHVLCMDYVKGLSAQWACSETYSPDQRDQWGQVLLRFVLKGLFSHRYLHADPNLANFAFLPDGCLVVYDFGCVKRVPAKVSQAYTQLTRAVLAEEPKDLEPLLRELGIYRLDGRPLPQDMLREYAALLAQPFEVGREYQFGGDDNIYTQLMDLGRKYWDIGANLNWPKDILFIDRTLAGQFGNLCRLGAAGPWRKILMDCLAGPAV
ncbi:MAG: AarF/ABC1/UbiB kinase family protein [Desulfobacterales bacterium]